MATCVYVVDHEKRENLGRFYPNIVLPTLAGQVCCGSASWGGYSAK